MHRCACNRCEHVCVCVCEWEEAGLAVNTAHTWLNYLWPQNKKVAPSIYSPQDDYKSHSPGPRPDHSLPTLPHLPRWRPEPCCLTLSLDGLAHGCPGPGRPQSVRGSRVVLKGSEHRPGPRGLLGSLETPPLDCLPALRTSLGKTDQSRTSE